MIEPYFQRGGITLYHGDARDVLPLLPGVDLVLTDPPYGIAHTWKGGVGHGWGNARAQAAVRNEWDREPPSDEFIRAVVAKGR